MLTVNEDFVKDKKVLIRADIDVPLENGEIVDDFRLKSGLETLNLCLQAASQVIIMGHLGRPEGTEDPKLSVKVIYDWLVKQGYETALNNSQLKLLENLRFESGEEAADLDYAKALASYGEVYINEAFASYHKAASTTVLPTLLPHAAGLQFTKEVQKLTEVRENPQQPLVAIMGGAKVEDKLPVIQVLAKLANKVLVGGKLAAEIRQQQLVLPQNVVIAELTPDGEDITAETVKNWDFHIKPAKMIVWNGPLGKVENSKNNQTLEIARSVMYSGAYSIIGGGDTTGYLNKLNLLSAFGFVSTGGGAMLKFLTDGTLPSIEALK